MPQTPHLLQLLEKTFPNTSSYGRDPWFSEERSNLGIILRMLSIIQHWSPHPTNVVPNCRTSSPNRKSHDQFRDCRHKLPIQSPPGQCCPQFPNFVSKPE